MGLDHDSHACPSKSGQRADFVPTELQLSSATELPASKAACVTTTILKETEHGSHTELIMVLSKIMFYLQDGCKPPSMAAGASVKTSCMKTNGRSLDIAYHL